MFSIKQRVYLMWLVVIEVRQAMDEHDGDQQWYTKAKNRLEQRTRSGRQFQRMNMDEMAKDLLAMVIDEVSGVTEAVNKRRKNKKAS